MIKLLFIVPYKELQPVVEQVLSEYKSEQKIVTSIHLLKSWELEGASFQGDAIIARGFTAQMMREEYPDIVCVPLQVTGYDIINAVKRAYEAYHPRRIAIIGSYLMVYNAENLNGIFNVDIRAYSTDGYEKIAEVIERAKADGCDCFIGGLSTVELCRTEDAAVMIETGRTAVIQSVDEAVRMVERTRLERNRAAWLRSIVDHSKEGIVFLDERGTITSINSNARHYLAADSGWVGRDSGETLPFAAPFLEEVRRTGSAITNEVLTVEGRLLTADFIPTLHGANVVGIILFFQSINRLQKEESIIRKKMHGKGLQAKYRFEDILCRSASMKQAIHQAKVFAQTDSPILIVGESGTGKELFAQSIHNAGPRGNGPFVAINCAALPENLLESELFGYSEGSFTGALKGGKAGLFESAHGGTIFLDEISEIPISFQSKLLRVLQENEVRRIGDDKVLSIDTRVIAATNRNLREQVRKGLFRQDLLFRLDVLRISIPPLRDRPGDLIGLFELYIAEFSKKYQKEIMVISSEAKKILEKYYWEGNVRELRNIAERICVLNDEGMIGADIVRGVLDNEYTAALLSRQEMGVEEVVSEKERLRELLDRFSGHKGRVADYLGVNRSTLWRKMKKYNLLP